MVAVDNQGLADNVLNTHARIERGVRVLENNLHAPPQLAQLPWQRPSGGCGHRGEIAPESGSIRRSSRRATVLFPEPDSPTMPSV